MKNHSCLKILLIFFLGILLSGCSGSFWGGAGSGAVGAGAGYEINLERQMQRIEDDLESGKITREEYEIRRDQIRRDSLIK